MSLVADRRKAPSPKSQETLLFRSICPTIESGDGDIFNSETVQIACILFRWVSSSLPEARLLVAHRSHNVSYKRLLDSYRAN